MRLFRLPLILLSISPIISLYRGYQATQARVQGLMNDHEAQRQLLNNALFASVVYLFFVIGCIMHLRWKTQLGTTRKTLWTIALILFPVIAIPAYLILHGADGRTKTS